MTEIEKRRWTQEEEDTLRDMVARGMHVSECAAALGRSKWSVIGRAQRSGIRLIPDNHPRVLWTEAELDILRAFCEDMGRSPFSIVHGLSVIAKDP